MKVADAGNGSEKLPKLLTEEEAARVLRVSPKTLTTWRSSGRYPLSYIKVGGRVVYELVALREFIHNRTITRRVRSSAAPRRIARA